MMRRGLQFEALASLAPQFAGPTRLELFCGDAPLVAPGYLTISLVAGAWLFTKGSVANVVEIVAPLATGSWPTVDGALLSGNAGPLLYFRLAAQTLGIREQLRFMPGDLNWSLLDG